MRLHPWQGLKALVRLARRGIAARPAQPPRRRALLLQIDGLSSARLRQALGRGEMPHLQRLLSRGELRLRSLTAATPPSTPVFQAGLLYGAAGDLPGFGWYDRDLGRVVRMDSGEDVAAIEETLERARPLLSGGVTYGTIWHGGAEEGFFNVVWFLHGAARRLSRNFYDRLLSAWGGVAVAGRLLSRFLLELAVGLYDFQRWCRRIGSTRFEWRFLYMRLFVAVVAREMATQGAIVDVLRGVPIIYLDFLGYDEYAHRRGPDSEPALYNLAGIDEAIGKLERATRAVPEYGYDLYVFSDHGQSATQPFERVVGRDLHAFVLLHAGGDEAGVPFGIEVVTGGTIAHLYFRPCADKPGVDAIGRRWPELFHALVHCPAIGLLVGRGPRGAVVYFRGRRYDVADRRRVERLEPFRRLGYELLARHLHAAADGRRSGDLVLYGAFAGAGSVTFDFEFGSHGGIGPEELDQFVAHPASVEWPLSGAVGAGEFHQFFSARY